MPKRVVVIVPFALDETGMANRRSQLDSVSLGPDIEFDFRPVKAGPALLDSYHDAILADLAMYEAGVTAQEDGYDAVCIDTMSDSGVNALRSMLDIPVIGPGRASYLTALMLGSKFSVLTQWDGWKALYVRGVRELGLDRQCASIRSINVLPDVKNLLGGKEEVVFPKLVGRGHALHRGGRRRGHLPGLHDDAPGARAPRREAAGAGRQPGAADLRAGADAAGDGPLAEPHRLPARRTSRSARWPRRCWRRPPPPRPRRSSRRRRRAIRRAFANSRSRSARSGAPSHAIRSPSSSANQRAPCDSAASCAGSPLATTSTRTSRCRWAGTSPRAGIGCTSTSSGSGASGCSATSAPSPPAPRAARSPRSARRRPARRGRPAAASAPACGGGRGRRARRRRRRPSPSR